MKSAYRSLYILPTCDSWSNPLPVNTPNGAVRKSRVSGLTLWTGKATSKCFNSLSRWRSAATRFHASSSADSSLYPANIFFPGLRSPCRVTRNTRDKASPPPSLGRDPSWARSSQLPGTKSPGFDGLRRVVANRRSKRAMTNIDARQPPPNVAVEPVSLGQSSDARTPSCYRTMGRYCSGRPGIFFLGSFGKSSCRTHANIQRY